MRKIFSLSLIAVALLISGQVKADEVTVTTYADLKTQIEGATGERTINVAQDLTGSPMISIQNGQVITLNLSNKATITADGEISLLRISHGTLSVTGQGTLTSTCSYDGWKTLITLVGSTDPSAENYSVLNIGEGITLTCKTTAIDVMNVTKTQCSYGVKINMAGYAYADAGPFSVSGNIQAKTGNVPEITISGTAACAKENFYVPEWEENMDPNGIYAAGYAIWYITGTVTGSLPIYAKSGVFYITNATIIATQPVAEGTYEGPTANGNGSTGGQGSAIVLDSKDGYAGGIVLNISGNSTITASDNAFALHELKTDATQSKVESVIVSGGTVNGNINTTVEVKDDCKLNGSITGGTFSDQTIKDYIPNVNGVIEVKTVGEETVYVVNGMPEGKSWQTDLKQADEDSYVKVVSNKKDTISADKTIKYLNVPGKDTLVVTNGATFSIGEAVLGSDAVLEVEPGSKVIIEETNGVIAFEPENLIIKANAEDGMATFLIHPAVKANKSPKATIEFMTNAACGKKDNSALGAPNDYKWEMIASPFIKIDTIISEVPTYYERIENNAFVRRSKKVIIDETVPFEMLAICPDAAPKEGGYKYTFVGTLQGANDLKDFEVVKKFNYLGNAYTAKMDAEEMISELKEGESAVRSVVYLWNAVNMKWDVYNSKELPKDNKIKPMDAFVLYSDADGKVSLDYEELIWNANK